jgi:hypothetical protein
MHPAFKACKNGMLANSVQNAPENDRQQEWFARAMVGGESRIAVSIPIRMRTWNIVQRFLKYQFSFTFLKPCA